MKKALSLLFISTSVFSMQLAHRIQAPRFVKQAMATVNIVSKEVTEKASVKHNKVIEFNTPKFKIDSASVRTSHYAAGAQLYHGKNGFVVIKDGEKHQIEKVLMNKTARDMDKKHLKHFLNFGFFHLDQANDGKFTLKAHYRLPGRGVIGASIGAFFGKAAVSVLGHGAIHLVALCTGPAYLPTVFALEGCFGAAIESSSYAAGIAAGMALGVATGPV